MTTILQILTFNAFDPRLIYIFAIMAVLLMVSALVSGAETSLFSLSPSNIHAIKKHRSPADNAILKLLTMQDYLLATILIVNNMVNILIVMLANEAINKMAIFSSTTWEFVVKVIVVTFLLLLFGEIMPKVFASYNALRFARFASRPLLVLKSIFKPLSYILITSGNFITNAVARKSSNLSIGELSNAIEMTNTQSDEERQMLSGIVNFASTEVSQVMRPRVDMVALDITADYDQVKSVIIESGFSRIPVYEDNIDDIKGLLYVKDMLAYIANDKDFEWQRFLRKPYFVPDHKKINDLLEEFQLHKVHIAVVVDEYGSTLGLVSLEDIMEEIVGEITDESDSIEDSFYVKIDDNTYIFDGKTHLNDFAEILGLEADHLRDVGGDAETVAGLMLEIKGYFLKKGESVSTHSLRLTVEALDGRRIDKVRVVKTGE